jgi:NAD(P)-dependent dehydrogenase (short-subunit alcohol dehydrogenase family)
VNPTYDFAGQVALVTGGSSGMGFATARAFAEAGAAVVIADINESTLGTATEELTAAGHRVLGVRCDVSDEDSVAAMVKATVDTFDRLDMAFNNAGIQSDAVELADVSLAEYDRIVGINLRGVYACMKYQLGHMRERGAGAIVNCSSLGGFVGVPGRAAYHAAKHGIHGITKSAGLEYAARHPRERSGPRDHGHADGREHEAGRGRSDRGNDAGCADQAPRPCG